MNCRMPEMLVIHCVLEFTQSHAHCVNGATQPFHSLSLSSPPDLNLSQHQGLFQWVGSLLTGSQRIGALASASVLPVNIQGWCPLGWTAWISLQTKGLSVSPSTTVRKHQFFDSRTFLWPNSYTCTWLMEKPWLWLYGPLSAIMSLLFNMLSGLVIDFLPRSKHLLISWLQSPHSVIMKPKKIKFVTASSFSPSICHEWWHQTPWY